MIDFIKIRYPNPDIEHLKYVPGTDWTSSTKDETKALKGKFSLFNELSLAVKPSHEGSVLIIQGSIHKHFYNGSNSGDFSFSDLTKAISDLCETLKIDPHRAKVSTFEFGVNMLTPTPPEDIISRLLHVGRYPFIAMSGDGKPSRGLYRKGNKRKIKVYRKAPEMLRFEVSAIKMVFVEKARISTLSDLLKKENLAQLGHILIEQFKSIEKTECVDQSKMSEKQINAFKLFSFGEHWQRIRQEDRATGKDRFRSQTKVHRDLVNEFRLQDTEAETVKAMEAKICELLDISLEQFRSYDPSLKAINDDAKMSKVTDLADSDSQPKMSKVTDLAGRANPDENVESHPLLTIVSNDIKETGLKGDVEGEGIDIKIENCFDAFIDAEGCLFIPTPMAKTYTIYQSIEDYSHRKELPTFQPKSEIDQSSLTKVKIDRNSLRMFVRVRGSLS